MRENIGLYKAKRKDNGDWVYGCMQFDSLRKVYWIVEEVDDSYYDGVENVEQRAFNEYEIDPETLCECVSGQKDKNKKNIFEHDIVWLKIEDDRDYETDGYVEAEVCWIIEKEYDEPAYCGFGLRVIKSDKWFEKGEEYLRQEDLNFDISLFETEVIGNKFDNK